MKNKGYASFLGRVGGGGGGGGGWRGENKVYYGRWASGVYGHNLARVEGELAKTSYPQ